MTAAPHHDGETLEEAPNASYSSFLRAAADSAPQLLFCYLVPKVELHAHLNGSISSALLRHLASLRANNAAADVQGTDSTPSVLLTLEDDSLARIVNPKERMAFCFRVFDEIYKVMDNLMFTRLAVQDMLFHYASENTLWLEIRTSLREGMKHHVDTVAGTKRERDDTATATQQDYLETVRWTIDRLLSGAVFDLDTAEEICLATATASQRAAWLQRLDAVYASQSLMPFPLASLKGIDLDVIAKQLLNGGKTSPFASSMIEFLRRAATDGAQVVKASDTFLSVIQPNLCKMHVSLCVSVSRSLPLTAAVGTLRVVESMLSKNALHPSSPITGIDFSGNCYRQSFHDFVPILTEARDKHHLRITLHAGEKDDIKELREMISFSPDRWGHLVFTDAESLSQILHQLKKPIEICIKSNLLTCGHDAVDDHHIGSLWHVEEYIEAARGLFLLPHENPTSRSPSITTAPLSINTDDRGTCFTSMTMELNSVLDHSAVKKMTDLRGRNALVWFLEWRALDDAFYPTSADGTSSPLELMQKCFDGWYS